MKFQITMTDTVYDTVHTLMQNNEILNDGNEIGAWLTGSWTTDENTHTLLLDKFVIPKQTVTRIEVDMSPESMIDTINEIGIKESNRIKAHWHIHPFNKGKTDWSQTDEDAITELMSPNKNREIFVFLLSSLDEIKARVQINLKTQLLGQTITIQNTFDNLPVERQTQKHTEILQHLQEKIKEKVSVQVEPQQVGYQYGNNVWDSYGHTKQYMPEEPYVIRVGKNRVHLKLDNELAIHITHLANESLLLSCPTKIKHHRNSQTWKYATDGDFRTTKELKEQLELDLDEVLRVIELQDNTPVHQGIMQQYREYM